MVAVHRGKTEVWIVDPLCLQPAKELATNFESRDYKFHNFMAPLTTKIAHTMNCSYLAVGGANGFLYDRSEAAWKHPRAVQRQAPLDRRHC